MGVFLPYKFDLLRPAVDKVDHDPALRRQIRDLWDVVDKATLSVGEQAQLRQLAEFLLAKLAS